jgi:DNA uptake protein ComE-like DNA-binding protein
MIHRLRTTSALTLAFALVACGGDEPADAASAAAEAEVAAEVETAADTSAPQSSAELVNPNTADEASLAGVPGMTDELVAFVMAERPFVDMLEFDDLISPTLDIEAREALYEHLFIPLDLNGASEAEILLIPGVGDRMAHEFDEYRPYDAIERFRREIGKYVDEAEVARLERYVQIR